MRLVFADFLSENGTRLPSNFSLRIDRNPLKRDRSVLFLGGVVAVRSRTLRGPLHALASFVAGLEDADPQHPRLNLRVFRRGDLAVIADLERPLLVDDSGLRKAGISEAYLWQPVVDSANFRVLAPITSRSTWRQPAINTRSVAANLSIVGLISRRTVDGSPDLRSLCGQALNNQDAWLNVIIRMCDLGLTRSYDSEEVARQSLIELFGYEPPRHESN